MATEDVSLDLSKLLSSEERDFLIRNNGDQVLLLAYEFL
jgi:nucleoredoxin